MEVINDIAIQYGGTVENNVIRQKETHILNKPSFMEVVFLCEGSVNIPNKIGDYELTKQSNNYEYTLNKKLITVNAVYEEPKQLKGYVDFSNTTIHYDEESNFFPYSELGQGAYSGNFSLPNDWKIYLDLKGENIISINAIVSELIDKGGYYIDYASKTIEKYDNLTSHDISNSEIIDDVSFNFRTNINKDNREIYIIAKNDKVLQEPIFIENEEELEEKTIVSGDESPDIAPEHITEIHDLSLNHDVSGEKKTLKTTVVIGSDRKKKETTVTYGFEYIADGNIDFISEKGRVIEITDPSIYWKKIEEVTKHYYYDDGNNGSQLLLRVVTSGFKRGRFRIESDENFETHKYGEHQFNFRNGQPFLEENRNHNEWKRNDFLFKKFPIEGILQREYHPLSYYFNVNRGRELEDVFLIHQFYDIDKRKVKTEFKKNKNWVEPFFLTGEYFYSACIGYSYNKYMNKDGEYEIKKNSNIIPSVFGETKEYSKTFFFYSNKEEPFTSFGINKYINIDYLEEDEENYYTETIKIYQSGNEDFKEVAEKTEIITHSGTPPIAERRPKVIYEYDNISTTEPYIEIPANYSTEKNEVLIVDTDVDNPISVEEIKFEGQQIKPNEYDIALSKNLKKAQENIVAKLKITDDSIKVGHFVRLEGFNINQKLIVVSVSHVIDTTDKFSSGLFSNGSVRTTKYTEIELGIFEDSYNQKTENFNLNNANGTINVIMPVLEGDAVGYSRQATKSRVLNIPNRGNGIPLLDINQNN